MLRDGGKSNAFRPHLCYPFWMISDLFSFIVLPYVVKICTLTFFISQNAAKLKNVSTKPLTTCPKVGCSRKSIFGGSLEVNCFSLVDGFVLY